MVMPSSGTITMAQAQAEVGGAADLNAVNMRRLAQAASTGAVAMSNMYGQGGWLKNPQFCGEYTSIVMAGGAQHTFTGVNFGGSADATKQIVLVIHTSNGHATLNQISVTGETHNIIMNCGGQTGISPSIHAAVSMTQSTSGNVTLNFSQGIIGCLAMHVFQVNGRTARECSTTLSWHWASGSSAQSSLGNIGGGFGGGYGMYICGTNTMVNSSQLGFTQNNLCSAQATMPQAPVYGGVTSDLANLYSANRPAYGVAGWAGGTLKARSSIICSAGLGDISSHIVGSAQSGYYGYTYYGGRTAIGYVANSPAF